MVPTDYKELLVEGNARMEAVQRVVAGPSWPTTSSRAPGPSSVEGLLSERKRK
jgi:hypothetical protein